MVRVAAYCRVSTEQDDQANSFEAQQRYFREWIARNPDWELQGIYADGCVIIGLNEEPDIDLVRFSALGDICQ